MIVFILFFLNLLIYAVFSYSLVDPNLVLSSNIYYQSFQNWMWTTLYHNGQLLAYIYFGIIISLYILYFHILDRLKNKEISIKKIIKNKYFFLFIILIFPILISYNALSHDVFNYIFNARMIVLYGADPHISTALDFSNDLWVRFMHNTHTPAPYGKGWTYTSLIPYLMGLGKLSLTLVSFRIWNLLSLILLYLSMQYFSKTLNNRNMNLYESALVFLNPFLLIEVISNYHNDILMMPFAVLAVSLLIKPITSKIEDNKQKLKFIVLSLLALAISISIKLATVALLPLWLLVIGASYFSFKFVSKMATKFRIKINESSYNKLIYTLFGKFVGYIPDLAAGLMMLLLFTPRSNYFLPWYMIWVIVWIPFMKSKLFRNLIIIFTLSSSLRYLPWLFNNLLYSDQVLRNQKLITWIIPGIYLLSRFGKVGQTTNKS